MLRSVSKSRAADTSRTRARAFSMSILFLLCVWLLPVLDYLAFYILDNDRLVMMLGYSLNSEDSTAPTRSVS